MTEKSKKLLNLLKTNRLYFDGGMGTLIQAMDENIPLDEKVYTIMRAYLEAGSNIITSNTFNMSAQMPGDPEAFVRDALGLAKKACADFENSFIAFDVGPTGKLLSPLGNVSFDEAVEIFSSSIRYAEKYGADLIAIETMTDLNEALAAVTAAKSVSSLPVFVTCAYSENGRLLTGAKPSEVVKTLEEAGADALGTNCSFGPDKLIPVVEELVKYSSVPVIVNPNAGLPIIKDGKASYDIDADKFSDYMSQIANLGACILGGCCGTTPEHIRMTIEKTSKIPYRYPEKKDSSVFEDTDNDAVVLSFESPLKEAIFEGEEELAKDETLKLLGTNTPLDIINNHIIPVLNEVGAEFEKGNLFISELMMCAETASIAFEILKSRMTRTQEENNKKIILATVKGDVHDIGKDIVKTLLESYGFNVIDLGIDVDSETMQKAVEENDCRLVGLSALMTTTIPAMASSIELLHSNGDTKIIVGGAVLTPELAKDLNADFYSPNAMATVNHALQYYN